MGKYQTLLTQEDYEIRIRKKWKGKITAYELLRKTLEREFLLKQLGYRVITIWEYDYLRGVI